MQLEELATRRRGKKITHSTKFKNNYLKLKFLSICTRNKKRMKYSNFECTLIINSKKESSYQIISYHCIPYHVYSCPNTEYFNIVVLLSLLTCVMYHVCFSCEHLQIKQRMYHFFIFLFFIIILRTLFELWNTFLTSCPFIECTQPDLQHFSVDSSLVQSGFNIMVCLLSSIFLCTLCHIALAAIISI